MTAAGIGARKNTSPEDVLAAVDAALARYGLTRAALDTLATVPLKKDEAGLREAARRLGLPLFVAGERELSDAADRTMTRSAASVAATGTPSASEAAALAAAGPTGRLLGPRVVVGNVSCAVARSEDS